MMLRAIFPALGILLILFSAASLAPIIVALIYNELEASIFITTFWLTFFSGLILWLPFRHLNYDPQYREGLLITVLFWVVLGVVGALPFLMMPSLNLSLTDALFESLSGLTTTGATILTQIETLPKSILFYRQQLQWFGGMGIVILAVALLPLFGVQGIQRYRSKFIFHIQETKLPPHIIETAKSLWWIYLALTILCAGAYWLAGMNLFDAVCHSFSTISIGGFSNYDNSMGYFNSSSISYVAMLFMLLAGVNFSLHFVTWQKKSLQHYWQDSEIRWYIAIVLIASSLTVFALYSSDTYSLSHSFRYGAFEVISVATTTGFTATESFAAWPAFLPLLLFSTSFIGGCAGSTAGGIKIVRTMLLVKQGLLGLQRLMHPHMPKFMKIKQASIKPAVSSAVGGFVCIYILTFIVMFLLLLTTGLDGVTAFSSVASCLNNLGTGLGDAASSYQSLPDSAKWILTSAMLLGRLEIFSLLIILIPSYWRTNKAAEQNC